MAISTLAELQAAISNWTARADLASGGANVARTLEFIALAENRMNRDLARIGAGELVSTSLSATAEAIDLPADFNGMRFLGVNGSSVDALTYVTPEKLYELYPSSAAKKPRWYTIHGKDGVSDVLQARFRPIPDGVYALLAYYYKKVATVTGGVANWMLTNNPDCYLYSSLIEAYNWLGDDASTQKCGTLYAQALKDVKALDDARRVGGIAPRGQPGVRMIRGM